MCGQRTHLYTRTHTDERSLLNSLCRHIYHLYAVLCYLNAGYVCFHSPSVWSLRLGFIGLVSSILCVWLFVEFNFNMINQMKHVHWASEAKTSMSPTDSKRRLDRYRLYTHAGKVKTQKGGNRTQKWGNGTNCWESLTAQLERSFYCQFVSICW